MVWSYSRRWKSNGLLGRACLSSRQAATAGGWAGPRRPELGSRGEALPCWGHLPGHSATHPPHTSPQPRGGAGREQVVQAGAGGLGEDGQCWHMQS